jgi:hypothetical protein
VVVDLGQVVVGVGVPDEPILPVLTRPHADEVGLQVVVAMIVVL